MRQRGWGWGISFELSCNMKKDFIHHGGVFNSKPDGMIVLGIGMREDCWGGEEKPTFFSVGFFLLKGQLYPVCVY